jgi:serine/threonine protein kinase
VHLHSLGILHRDLRAANLLIAGLDPLHVLVADLGLSHQLAAFVDGRQAPDLTASKAPSIVKGTASLGPQLVGEVGLSCFYSVLESCV